MGIMVYELLHGETPWECRTESELIEKMTKIPVKFKETLAVSPMVKDFIRKCLEVDETKRMSLAELKSWSSSNNMCHSNSQPETMAKKTVVQENPQSSGENKRTVKPLGDATNRFSLGV
jgi:serine/threonine protein kinase